MSRDVIQTTASIGETDAPATPAELGAGVVTETTSTGGTADPQITEIATSMDPEGTVPAGDAAVADDLEPPAGSSPEQSGRWRKHTDARKRAEEEVSAKSAEVTELRTRFQSIEPVLEPVNQLIAALTAAKPDVVGGIKAMKQIDAVGTNEIAGALMEEFGNDWVRSKLGVSLEDARRLIAAPQGAPAGQTLAALSPETLNDISQFVDPEVAQTIAAMQEQMAQMAEAGKTRGEQSERETAEQQAQQQREAIDAYNSQFDSDIGAMATTYKVVADTDEAKDYMAAIQRSLRESPADIDVIRQAQEAYLSGRTYLASQGTEAVRAVIRRHAQLVGDRLFKHRLEADVAAGQKAAEIAAAQAAAGITPTGGSLPPGPPQTQVAAPKNNTERLAQTQAKINDLAIQSGYQMVGGKWVPPS